MAKALLVDYGGVLTTAVMGSFESFCSAEGIDVATFTRRVLAAQRDARSPFVRVEVGEITQEQFDAEVAALIEEACGRPIDARGLKQRLFAGVGPDAAMIEAVRRAHDQGIHTALVSNSWGGGDYPTEIIAPLFDEMIFSGEVRLRKPDAAIYELAATRLGVAHADCVFVDDLRSNVEGARAVGMHAVLHRDATATIDELERFLGVPLRDAGSSADVLQGEG